MQTQMPDEVAFVFDSYEPVIRNKLLYLRQLILETAAAIEVVGSIEETLKWGEPSYLTSESKSGSTIRINRIKSDSNKYAIYFKCTADLVTAFRERYPKDFAYEKNRAIVFDLNDEVPLLQLKSCVVMALTYHLNKKLEVKARWDFVNKLVV